jgi:hypothetical protein
MGPLRYNLDPFCENSDDVLWDTLEIVSILQNEESKIRILFEALMLP